MDWLRVRDDVPTMEVTAYRNHIRQRNKQTRPATSSEGMKVDFGTMDVLMSPEIHPWMFQSCSVTCQCSIKGIRIRPLASVHLLLSRYCPVAIRLTDGSVHADKLPARRCLFRWIFAFRNLVDAFFTFFPFVFFF